LRHDVPTSLTFQGVCVTDVASPRAVRLATPRWLDARLAVGVLLVAVSVAAGARVFTAADNLTSVYVAAHDLVPGQHVTADDLAVGHVRLRTQAGLYVAAGSSPPVGYIVTRFVGAHELVPVAALAGGASVARTRFVTVPVQPGHLSDSLTRGDLVDVYLTGKSAAGEAAPDPTLVLAGAPVEARAGGTRTFSASSSYSVVLGVPIDKVVALVHAVESGTIDLVTVPTIDGATAPQPATDTP
jgi:hypothetical protein